jgi:endonuclease/exonuclease/phosphatase family metal-dependent hydrolase
MAAGNGGATFSLASFNVHMGIDGWGRPFDLVAECAALDADLLVLQEAWTPDGGGAGTASTVATALGYRVVAEAPLARGRLYTPVATSSRRWMPIFGQVRMMRPAHKLDGERHFGRAGRGRRPNVRGRWGVALLARIPVHDPDVLDLGRLRRDAARRVVVRCTTVLGGRTISVFGTHMSHITHFSPTQYRRLSRLLPPASTPAVLAGDMNMWGPPVNSFFPAWRRAVVGRTWPSWRPHSQLDHVLITPALSVVDARIAPASGSDHRPVRVTLALA